MKEQSIRKKEEKDQDFGASADHSTVHLPSTLFFSLTVFFPLFYSLTIKKQLLIE